MEFSCDARDPLLRLVREMRPARNGDRAAARDLRRMCHDVHQARVRAAREEHIARTEPRNQRQVVHEVIHAQLALPLDKQMRRLRHQVAHAWHLTRGHQPRHHRQWLGAQPEERSERLKLLSRGRHADVLQGAVAIRHVTLEDAGVADDHCSADPSQKLREAVRVIVVPVAEDDRHDIPEVRAECVGVCPGLRAVAGVEDHLACVRVDEHREPMPLAQPLAGQCVLPQHEHLKRSVCHQPAPPCESAPPPAHQAASARLSAAPRYARRSARSRGPCPRSPHA